MISCDMEERWENGNLVEGFLQDLQVGILGSVMRSVLKLKDRMMLEKCCCRG